jgi:hypothetical protein
MSKAKSNDTSDTPKPPSKRKSRPKFEVAPEQVTAPAASWVYREDGPTEAETPQTGTPKLRITSITVAKTKVHQHAEAKPADVKHEPKPSPPLSNHPAASIPMFAIGMMAMSIGAFVYVGLFAVKTLNSPVKMASGILGRLRRA